MNILNTPPSFSDQRGVITDLVQGETINAVTLVTFVTGAVRGNHYHKETTQWNLVLSGRLRVVSQIPGAVEFEVEIGAGDLAVCVPNERHAFEAIEDTEMMVFTRGPRGGREYESDTFRLEKPLIRTQG